MDRMFRLTERQTLLRLLFHPATFIKYILQLPPSHYAGQIKSLGRHQRRPRISGTKSRVTKFPPVRLDNNIRAMGFYVT